MELVRERISDRRVLKLIRQWMEAGVMEDGTVRSCPGSEAPARRSDHALASFSPGAVLFSHHHYPALSKNSPLSTALVALPARFVILIVTCPLTFHCR